MVSIKSLFTCSYLALNLILLIYIPEIEISQQNAILSVYGVDGLRDSWHNMCVIFLTSVASTNKPSCLWCWVDLCQNTFCFRLTRIIKDVVKI